LIPSIVFRSIILGHETVVSTGFSVQHCQRLFHFTGRVRITRGARLGDPRSPCGPRRLGFAAVRVRLAKLLVSGYLMFRIVADQSQKPLATLLDVSVAEALHCKAIAEKEIGRVVGQTLIQHQSPA
jgi:hypothetical protein